MQINIKLDRDFEIFLRRLMRKYPELAPMNGFAKDQLDYTCFIDNFIDKNVADASIDGNANASTKDITSLEQEMSKPHSKLLSFNKIFYEIKKKHGVKNARKWLRHEYLGDFYLHDGYNSSWKSYCFSYDLSDLARKGLFFIPNFNAQPPEHLTTFTDFVTEFVSWVSNRTSGGCSLPNFLIWSFYFWKKDVEKGYCIKSPEYYRDQEFQRHIYKLNQPYLRVTQSAYTTMSVLDRDYLMELFGGMEYPDGTFVVDYIDEILQYELDFIRVKQECCKNNMMTFPVMSYALIYDYEKHRFAHEDFARKCSDANYYWMVSNFSIDDGVNALASCCRLRNGLDDDKDTDSMGNFSSIGGSALEVGSVKVNTLNLARLAYRHPGDEKGFLKELAVWTNDCCEALDVIRNIIQRNVEKGLLPNYTLKIINIKKQYSTIGICALFECVQKMGYIRHDDFGNCEYTDKGIAFAKKIFDVITKIKTERRKVTGWRYNIEQIPGERACSILMHKDMFLYPNEKYDKALRSNQWLSLSEKTTIVEKVRVGEALDSYMGGGVISHFNLDAPFPNTDSAWKALCYVADHHIPYFAFNGRQSSCKHNHGFYGNKCPICGEPVETYWTRIVGFSRPITSFSKERYEEYGTRTWNDPHDYEEIF